MKAPNFWYQKKRTPLSYILSPIGWLIYKIGKNRFKNSPPYKGKTPIICIGNATAGGTGKTPTAIFIANKIKEMHLKPVFVTKGYGGSMEGPSFIDNTHNHKRTGDEAQLLKCHAPTIVAKDRVAGATLADQHNFDVIILDDGLQNHPSLYNKSYGNRFVIMTIDRMRGFGNEALVPAGPLREPLSSAYAKTDYAIIIGNSEIPVSETLKTQNTPILYAIREPLIHGEEFKGQNIIAFAGIGNPDQFFNMLKKLGCNILKQEAFPDHYDFPSTIIERLIKDAQNQDALLVTTEKDMVRIAPKYYAFMRPFLTNLTLSDEDEGILCQSLENFIVKTSN